MRVLVLGAGAVGGYFGALLFKAGHSVTMLARNAHAEAMRAHGLRIDSFREGELTVHPKVITSLADAVEDGPYDLVLAAVKTYSLGAMAEELRPLIPKLLTDDAVVLPLQNGVESEEVLVNQIGAERVLGAVAVITSFISEPGRITHLAYGDILVAPLPGTPPHRAQALADLLVANGVTGGFRDDLRVTMWRKLTWTAAFNAVTALTQNSIGACARHPALRALLRSAMAEVLAVAQAQDVPLTIDLDTWLTQQEPRTDQHTSMYFDYLARRPTEHDSLNGVVCRRGQRFGIATPVNQALYALLEGRNLAQP